MFSFIIPAYNCENYLTSCVESILSIQLNNADYEILLIDDGSSDGTAQICDELADKYLQIHVIHQQNAGVSAARNRGIQEARGEYLLFIDSDDTVNADKLSRILNDSRCMENDMTVFGMSFDYYHHGICYRRDELFYEYDGILTSSEWGNVYSLLFQKNSLSAIWNKVFRKDIIMKYALKLNATMFLYEDLDFVLRYMAHCGVIWNVPEAVYQYRQPEDEGNASRRLMRLTSVNACIKPIEDSMNGLMIIQKNIDHLFAKPSLSAVAAGQSRNPTWTNINSGLLVLEPDLVVYNELITAIEPTIKEKQINGQGYGDQDVLYRVFTLWKNQSEYHIDERYNAMLFCLKDIAAAYNIKSLDDIYVLHYVAANKIWNNNLIEALVDLTKDICYRKKLSFLAKIKYYSILNRSIEGISNAALQAMKAAAKQ